MCTQMLCLQQPGVTDPPGMDCNFDTILGCDNEILSKIQTKKKWHYDTSIKMLLCSLMFEIINPSKSLYLKKKLRESRPGNLRDCR